MIKAEVSEDFIRVVSAAIKTDEDRYEPDYIDALTDQYRAKAIWEMYRIDKRINSIWTQPFIAEFSSALQDERYLRKFVCPPVVSLDNKRDGFLYVGSLDGKTAYRKVVSTAELANEEAHRITRLNGRIIKYVFSDGFLKIRGNPSIQEVLADCIFMNPEDLPEYNVDFDNYPVDENTRVMMKRLAIAEMGVMAGTKPDFISDSTDKPNK